MAIAITSVCLSAGLSDTPTDSGPKKETAPMNKMWVRNAAARGDDSARRNVRERIKRRTFLTPRRTIVLIDPPTA